jgi:uncharacterized protein YjbJ (UPF0337 family)
MFIRNTTFWIVAKGGTMDDNTKDKFEGRGQEKKGEAKQAIRNLRKDEDQQSEGQFDQAGGKFKSGLADTKDKLKDAADDLKK